MFDCAGITANYQGVSTRDLDEMQPQGYRVKRRL